MPRGGPDWESPDYQLSGVQVDLSDIADRLLGFSRLDTRGRIVYLSDFRDGLGGWNLTSAFGGNNPVLKVGDKEGYVGPQYVYFDSAFVVGGQSALQRNQWFGVATRLGMEACYRSGLGEGETLWRIIYQPHGGTAYGASVRRVQPNDYFEIFTGGVWVRATPFDFPEAGASGFLQLKLVGDWATGKFDRLLIGETEFDLSAYPMQTGVGIYEGQAVFTIQQQTTVDFRQFFYLNYVIITKDEP